MVHSTYKFASQPNQGFNLKLGVASQNKRLYTTSDIASAYTTMIKPEKVWTTKLLKELVVLYCNPEYAKGCIYADNMTLIKR